MDITIHVTTTSIGFKKLHCCRYTIIKMSLDKEYERLFEKDELESLQSVIIKIVCGQIKSRQPRKLLSICFR